MLRSPKKGLANCLKRVKTLMVSSMKSALIVLMFVIVVQHESGARKNFIRFMI